MQIGTRSRASRCLRGVIATLAAVGVLLGVGARVALAGTVNVSIQGHTVTYSAQGLPPNTLVTVRIRNDATGSTTSQGPFDTGEQGILPPSTGTTGDRIAGGTRVTVSVHSVPDGNELASGSAEKPKRVSVLGMIGAAIDWLRRLF
jgi:hypothetical protein